MLARFAREGEFDCLLLAGRYTLIDHTGLRELLPICERKGISVIIGGPYNSGILATGARPELHNRCKGTAYIGERVSIGEGTVLEDGVMIVREALSNAFRHSSASEIEVEITYGKAAFRLRVRDDGQGISPTVLEAGGKPGHFGLMGLHERAKKLGGHLEIWSKPDAGTEIELRVPARLAYRRSQAGRVRALFNVFRSSAQPR